ncbi:MAG TPA: FAD-dependent oxidoreductase [Balneolaceae bacterium]|nr:FAD-dependent oxidoreductase [Balneolaceae bacterium]|tara:strand:- start:88491 stop:89594 length:1104 start_codon:yes stop_codon:yes gene_type:complete
MINAERSYWERALYEQEYDLIVVGAGLTGQSVAHFFKKDHPDSRVLIIERGSFPIGASTRNAGFACIGTIGEHLADLEIESEEKVKTRIKERFQGLQLLRSVIGDENMDYIHSGAHEIFTDKKEFEQAAKSIDRFNGWMKDLIGEPVMYSETVYNGHPAIKQTQEGMLHPGKMIHRLIRLNMELGIEYRWNTAVTELNEEHSSVGTATGMKLKAENLVLATNAFTRSLLPGIEIQPGRGFVFVTKPIKNLTWKGTFHFHKGYVYFRNIGNDRLLLGGARHVDAEGENTPDFGVNEQIRSYLIDFANRVIGLPTGWEIGEQWSGIMGFTPTKSAFIEPISDKTLLVSGLSGMGVALGMQLGKNAVSHL